MATKARHLKTPIQLWIADNRKRLGLESAELAQLTGVTEDTARGWESRGRPSEDAIAVLERRFGVPAPRGDQVPTGDGGVAAAIRDQTAMLERLLEPLVTELRLARSTPAPADLETLLRYAREQGWLSPADDPDRQPVGRS